MATKKPGANGVFEFADLFAQYKLPTVDVSALVATQRKNVEALVEANKLIAEGFQTIAQRQAKIFQDAFAGFSASATKIADAAPEAKLNTQVDLVKGQIEAAIANGRELAEVAAKSQADAAAIVQKRVLASLEEVKGLIAA